MHKLKIKIKDWVVSRAESQYVKYWLALVSFSESSFFVIPPDVLLLAVIVANSSKWFYYTTLTTIFSVLGGLFGYFLGYVFFDPVWDLLIAPYNLEEQMILVAEQFSNNAFMAVFLAAFTPIPYKLFTISSGFFNINLLTFFIASLAGRGLRLFSVSYVVKLFGKQIAEYTFKYFNVLTVAFVVLIVAFWFI
ncbi:YqaA family protein [Patescibacteria group bacterium]